MDTFGDVVRDIRLQWGEMPMSVGKTCFCVAVWSVDGQMCIVVVAVDRSQKCSCDIVDTVDTVTM